MIYFYLKLNIVYNREKWSNYYELKFIFAFAKHQ